MVMTTVRLEKGVKDKFDSLCKAFGMSANTAFTIYVNKVIEEGRIPFSVGRNASGSRDISILDRLSGAWNDGVSADDLSAKIRSGRSFGNTRVIEDY